MLTQEYLKKHLTYNPETGEFWWRTPGPGRNLKRQAGHVNKRGYRRIYLLGRLYRASHLAFLYMLNIWPEEVDHRDRNPRNDIWENLKEGTHQENMVNLKKYSNNTSGVTGVYWVERDQKWQAEISRERKKYYLGSFTDFKDAVKARKDAETYY